MPSGRAEPAPDNVHYTVWEIQVPSRTIRGLFHYNRRMDEAFAGLTGYRRVVDDVVIYDSDTHQHANHVRQFLQRCAEQQITLNSGSSPNHKSPSPDSDYQHRGTPSTNPSLRRSRVFQPQPAAPTSAHSSASPTSSQQAPTHSPISWHPCAHCSAQRMSSCGHPT